MTGAGEKPEDESPLLSIPEWQRRLLDERLADLEQNPHEEQTWEEVKAELPGRLGFGEVGDAPPVW